jgi:hypothetical protein
MRGSQAGPLVATGPTGATPVAADYERLSVARPQVAQVTGERSTPVFL